MKSNYILSGIFALLFIIFLSFQFQGEDIPKNKNEYEYSKTSEMPNMKIEKGKPYSFDAETGCIRGFLTKETYAEVEGCYSEITLISDKDTILGGVNCDDEGIFFERMVLNVYEGEDKAQKNDDYDKFFYISDVLEIKASSGEVWEIQRQADTFVIENYVEDEMKDRNSIPPNEDWHYWFCNDSLLKVIPNDEPFVFNIGNGPKKNDASLRILGEEKKYNVDIPTLKEGEVYKTDIWLDKGDKLDKLATLADDHNQAKAKTSGKWHDLPHPIPGDLVFEQSGYLKIKAVKCTAVSYILIGRGHHEVTLQPDEKHCVSTTPGDELIVKSNHKVKFSDDWYTSVRYLARGDEICFKNGKSKNEVEYYFDKRKGY